MNLRPIGVVRSEIRERKKMLALGAPASVEIFEEFMPGLHRVEKHSHVWVLAWLDGERDVLQVTPRGVADRSAAGLHGVFAVRSPARPNPIGLTAARVTGIDGRLIHLDRLDFIDGTEVVDVKPYFVTRDTIFSATNVQIGRSADRMALRESLLMQAAQFHGEICEELELAVGVVERFRAEVLDLNDPPEWRIATPAHRPHVIDAIMGMTRASLGRDSLRLHEPDCVIFTLGEQRYSYDLAPPVR